MNNISKQELISNLQDKITQFKSNFSKIKESRKEVPELNFEINRDALKLFYKKKAETEGQSQNEYPISSKPRQNMDEIFNIQNIINENNNKLQKINQNVKGEEKLINKNEKEENQMNDGAKIKKSFTFGSKEGYNSDINDIKNINNNVNINQEYQNNNINNNIYNINVNRNVEINNKDNLNIIEFNEANLKNNEFKKPDLNKNNNIISNLDINTTDNLQFNIDKIKNNKKLEKRDKSAPKISINHKLNNFYSEKPLTDKKHDNIKNINHTSNYNQLLNINNNRRPDKTEELYQKLLMNFNINSSSNKRDRTFYNLNYINNNNNNRFNREDNPNKSYGQINIRDTNLLYDLNGNSNYNYYNLQKRNYYRNGLNLDHLKDLYSKKTEDSKRPTQSMFKSKMDMFYQELNEYKNANYNKKKELNNYSKKNRYMNNNNYMANTQYKEYTKINNNSNMNNYQNMKNENNNINKSIFNGNKIGYNEILAVKNYLNSLSKDEINNLPTEIKNELKDIFNILYQKLNY